MGLVKGLLKATHDVIAEHIADNILKKVNVSKTLKELETMYQVDNTSSGDKVMNHHATNNFTLKQTIDKNSKTVLDIKGNASHHITCKSIDNQITIDGIIYKMMPVQVQDKSGKPKQNCKEMKVHKKLEGTEVPVKK